jgi:ribosomal protein S21
MTLRYGAILVTVKDSLERAVRVLKRKVQQSGKIATCKKRRSFMPPSQKRKLKKLEVQKKIRRAQLENARRFA